MAHSTACFALDYNRRIIIVQAYRLICASKPKLKLNEFDNQTASVLLKCDFFTHFGSFFLET